MTPDEARALGAQALFGEKYGDEVRVVSMGRAPTGMGADRQTYSIELCGGTHVARTGDIGLFVLLGDSASAAGIRRVEALPAPVPSATWLGRDRLLTGVAQALKVPVDEVPARLRAVLEERRSLQNEVAQLRREVAMGGGVRPAEASRTVGGVPFVGQVVQGVTGKDLPALIDEHKARLGSGAVVLIADSGGKAAVAAGVTSDLVGRVSAIDLVRAAVGELGGRGGGGRPDLAQGGGRDTANADRAIAAAEKVLEG